MCVCVCVFSEIHVFKIFIERWFWELNMLIGLHSCLCFSHLEKLVLKAGSTPSQYLLDTMLSVELIQLLDTWWIDRASVLGSDELFLDTSSIPQLSTTISWHLPWQVSRYLSTPTSVEIYCWHYLSSLCNPKLISFNISLDTSLFFLLNFLISLQSQSSKVSSNFFKIFFS